MNPGHESLGPTESQELAAKEEEPTFGFAAFSALRHIIPDTKDFQQFVLSLRFSAEDERKKQDEKKKKKPGEDAEDFGAMTADVGAVRETHRTLSRRVRHAAVSTRPLLLLPSECSVVCAALPLSSESACRITRRSANCPPPWPLCAHHALPSLPSLPSFPRCPRPSRR